VSSIDPQPRLAAVGDNCIDILRPSGHRYVGGNAVNVAVQFARLGGFSSYFGAVGEDVDGALTCEVLGHNGVDIDHLVQRPLPTARTEIDVLDNGERRLTFEDFGACAGYAPDAEAVTALLAIEHVHIGWLDDGGTLRRRLAAAGRSVSQDITVNASPQNLGVEGLSIAFASVDGSHRTASRLASSLISDGALGVVVMRGSRGSSVFLNGAEADIPTRLITPVDTTGAGDSYIAAFLHALLSGASPVAAGESATAHAAATCMHEGGFPQKPAG
jgi:fructoselysine 6-kinase